MLSVLGTATTWLSRKLKRRNYPKCWKRDKFEKKNYKEYTGLKFQMFEESKDGTLSFCCESDKTYNPIVTEVVKKIGSYYSSNTSFS